MFIGSCTNGRIEDFRDAAEMAVGNAKWQKVLRLLLYQALIHVKLQAEKEGIDKIFKDAGWEWREPGCSMCLSNEWR